MTGVSRQARLKDVAREAGVSAATASRVLNGSDRAVAEDFRARVLAAAEKVGYLPNLAAQATVRGHYPAIGLVVGDLRDQYFARVAHGVILEATRHDLVVNIQSTEGDAGREHSLIRDLRRQRPQYLVLVRKRDEEQARAELLTELRQFEVEGGRVVVVGESTDRVPAVRPPDFDGGKALAIALVGLGYRSFAAICSTDKASWRERLDGFRTGLSAAGIALPDSAIATTEHSLPGGVAAMSDLLARLDPLPELIFAIEDAIALGAVAELRRNGVEVPRDIAVSGYGDRELGLVDPTSITLSTVRTPLEEMGAVGVRSCVEPWAPTRPLIPQVILRGTTPRRRTRAV
ncbi:LacI family transcriptional regulator [Ruania suaedae]|uniref:LacI family DNA-binding transcriptional regulator n=1 Tax=Ruania suaedae TaxID=2897774 RepID=UPI001E506502|nr:LacI family DNA-binding transcriptional regulator [Ruania suaedae]UFU03121.1 LacI family transcriptional regulator [Ruania suaedae]